MIKTSNTKRTSSSALEEYKGHRYPRSSFKGRKVDPSDAKKKEKQEVQYLPSVGELDILMSLMDTTHKGFVNAADLHRIACLKDPALGLTKDPWIKTPQEQAAELMNINEADEDNDFFQIDGKNNSSVSPRTQKKQAAS